MNKVKDRAHYFSTNKRWDGANEFGTNKLYDGAFYFNTNEKLDGANEFGTNKLYDWALSLTRMRNEKEQMNL